MIARPAIEPWGAVHAIKWQLQHRYLSLEPLADLGQGR